MSEKTRHSAKAPPGKTGTGRAGKGKIGATQGAPARPSSRGKKAHASKEPTQRQLRVAEELRHVLSQIFARAEFRDPDLATAQITVTEIRISPDLKHATAFVARLGRSDVDALLPALKRAAPYLRAQLAHSLKNLRITPDLHFLSDTSIEYASYIDKLLHSPPVARDLD